MTSGQIATDTQHPTARLVSSLQTLLADHQGSPAWTMTPADLATQLPELAVVLNQLTAIQLQMLREADRHQVGDAVGAANTAAWWANTTRITKQAAHKAVALAGELDHCEHTSTATAMAAGAVSVDQAAVIVRAVDTLPTDLVEPALRRDAEAHLVGLAAHHDPRELRILGRRILDVIAPEISEAHEKVVLEAEERHALATASFSMRPDGHGSVIGRFKIPTVAAEILTRHLNAIVAPRHRAALDGQATPRTVIRPIRLGQAFVEYLETRARSGLPKAGGIPATIVVTMTLESLLGGAAAATLDSGERISASEARRLSCEAGIIPAVLGSPSQVLDVGRRARFHNQAQRIALGLRDKGCIVEGCDCPPSMCHAHHNNPWAKGGNTSVHDGSLVCPPHHALAHDDRYQLKAGKNGRVTFSLRT
jgi:hypothetical protein